MDDLNEMMADDARVQTAITDLCTTILGFKFQGIVAVALRLIDDEVHLVLTGEDDELSFEYRLLLTDKSYVSMGHDPTHVTFFEFLDACGNGLRFEEFQGDYYCYVINASPDDLDDPIHLTDGKMDVAIPWVKKVVEHVGVLAGPQGLPDVKECLCVAMSAMETARIYLLAQYPSADVSKINRAIVALQELE